MTARHFATLAVILSPVSVPAAFALEPCQGTVLTSPAGFSLPTTHIAFDVFPDLTPVPQFVPTLADQWRPLGLIIRDSSSENGASAYAETYGVPAHSPPNAIADSEGGTLGGWVRLSFVVPGTNTPCAVAEAGLWLQNGDWPDLVSFLDCQGQSICSVSPPGQGDTFVGLRAPSGIGAIVVTGTWFYLVDDVQFTAPMPCGNFPPEITQGAQTTMILTQDSVCADPPNRLSLTVVDPDGPVEQLTWQVSTSPARGTAEFVGPASGGSVVVCYWPNAGTQGEDQFIVTVRDAYNASDSIVVSVQIAAPCQSADRGDMNGDGRRDGADIQPFVAVLLDPGAATAAARCRADVSSATSRCAPDSSVDGHDGDAFLQLLLVGWCNLPPAIQGQDVRWLSVARNSACPIVANELAISAIDPDGPPEALHWGFSDGPSHGTATFVGASTGATVTVCYAPAAAYVGSDSFRVWVSDAAGDRDAVEVRVTIMNSAPQIDQGETTGLTVLAGSHCPGTANQLVLSATDTDSPPESLNWTLAQTPSTGAAVFVGTHVGTSVVVCYAPNPEQAAPDSFVVSVDDGYDVDSITVQVQVSPVAPVILEGGPIALSVWKNSVCPNPANRVQLSAADGDGPCSVLAWSIASGPTRGSVSFEGGSVGCDATLCYQPALDQAEPDSFTVRVTDPDLRSDDVLVTVTMLNAAPIIGQGNGPLQMQVVANSTCPAAGNEISLSATDPDGPDNQMSWSITVAAQHGAAAFVGSPVGSHVTLCYAPNPGQAAPDSFQVRVTDIDGATDNIVIEVTVLP